MKKFILSVFGCLACVLSFSLPSFAESLSSNEISFQMDEDFVIDRALENFESVSSNDFLLTSDGGVSTVDTSAIEEKLDKILNALGYTEVTVQGRLRTSSYLGEMVVGSGSISKLNSINSSIISFRNTLLPFISGGFVTLLLTYCLPRISKAMRKFFFLRRNSHD